MAVDLALNLPPDTSAPGLARAAAKRYVGGKVGPERLSELCLVISELVSNALVHGRGQVVLRLQLDEGIVRGEVIDEGGGFEHEIRARGPDDVSGRGLSLVEALTNRWGIHEGTTGELGRCCREAIRRGTVWFDLTVLASRERIEPSRRGRGYRPGTEPRAEREPNERYSGRGNRGRRGCRACSSDRGRSHARTR